MNKAVYQELASRVQARLNCIKAANSEWQEKHELVIRAVVENHLPSGSGVDNGTAIDLDKSTGNKLVLVTAYHHMNEGGMYDGWTEHVVTVRPSLRFGFELSVSGSDRNEIKSYLVDLFNGALNEAVTEKEILAVI